MMSMPLTDLSSEAGELVRAATQEQILVRVVGSTAIHLHCEHGAAAIERLRQGGGKDIDLIVRGADRTRLRKLIEDHGYEIDHDLLVAMEGKRFSFAHPETSVELDVFVDRMEFCHTLDVSRRMELHPLTIAVEDMLLAKLQVHDLTRSDLLDIVALLAVHPVGEGPEAHDAETIDSGYLARLLARDWGFHHTATANLARVAHALTSTEQPMLDAELDACAAARVERLCSAIDAADKSRGWRLRARIGERVQWWEDVDEREDTY